MICPHCGVSFFDDWKSYGFRYGENNNIGFSYRTDMCPSCKKWIIQHTDGGEKNWKYLVPASSGRPPIPESVPADIANDYTEACVVLPYSAKAAAALARRCLQNLLVKQGYQGGDLAKQIDVVLAETDPSRRLPTSVLDVIDAVRGFGNYSAHPITDKTTLQIIDVEPSEAEWCIEILESLFDYYYKMPEILAKKKAMLNEKLLAAGKPAAKSPSIP